jgi:hypothetical protein
LLSPRGQAQEQENKLVTRLLRPDMTLQNSAQKKKFVAAGAPQDRQAHVQRFFWQQKSNAKTFSNTREFSSQKFNSKSFNSGRNSADLTGKPVQKSDLAFGTHSATGLRVAANSDKKAGSQDFVGNRPFLGQGKSQKALSRQSRPMTIEEVRELLNKNK